jgi:hypothetical protein
MHRRIRQEIQRIRAYESFVEAVEYSKLYTTGEIDDMLVFWNRARKMRWSENEFTEQPALTINNLGI